MEVSFGIKALCVVLLSVGIYVFAYGILEDNAIARIIGSSCLVGLLIVLFDLIEKAGNYGS